MLGQKPQAVIRQVLRAGGAPPEKLAGTQLCSCGRCDEALLPLRAASCVGFGEVYSQPRGADRRAQNEGCIRRASLIISIVFNKTLVHAVAMVRPEGRNPSPRSRVFGKQVGLGRCERHGCLQEELVPGRHSVQHPSRERSRFLGNSLEETATCLNRNWMSWSFRRTVRSPGCAPSGGWSL